MSGGPGVGSSNLPAPTIFPFDFQGFRGTLSRSVDIVPLERIGKKVQIAKTAASGNAATTGRAAIKVTNRGRRSSASWGAWRRTPPPKADDNRECS
jgi:hypothetical protein